MVFQPKMRSDVEKLGSKLCCATFDKNFSGDQSSTPPQKEKNPKSRGHRRWKSTTTLAVPNKADVAMVVGHPLESIVEEEEKGRSRRMSGHRRLHSTGSEPRLMRSCGVRRDWTFHELLVQSEKEQVERI